MDDGHNLAVTAIHTLVGQHDLPTVLRAVASVMAASGNVTGGMISEAADLEAWLATHDGSSVGFLWRHPPN